MSKKTAADSLLQLAYAIRPDGKIPQFLCSTWARPHCVQPALLGWAAKRFVERAGVRAAGEAFIRTMASALCRNNEWWLTQRITESGLICCPHGLETGQDDSPRFDDGPVLAVDMNSYLLQQMRATAFFCRLAGDGALAAEWEARADAFAARLAAYLYDADKNLFFDADPETGERRTLVTLSSLIPLWAGVPLPEEKIRSMIEDYLLNEAYFFGNVPFPCVAYNEPVYEPAQWWRGPTWMPVAWLMMEILDTYGYTAERAQAARRLYRVLKKDAVLHELFDSSTGEGLGCDEQGWTAAIFIRLSQELSDLPEMQ
jgi:glycogen debranching enzyme